MDKIACEQKLFSAAKIGAEFHKDSFIWSIGHFHHITFIKYYFRHLKSFCLLALGEQTINAYQGYTLLKQNIITAALSVERVSLKKVLQLKAPDVKPIDDWHILPNFFPASHLHNYFFSFTKL